MPPSAIAILFVSILIPLILLKLGPDAEPAGAGQAPASPRAITRSCSANPVLHSTAKKPGKQKSSPPVEPPPTCVEVQGQAIEVQEFLQNLARREVWRTAENRASEDSWSCVRYLSDGELQKYADTKALSADITFTGGKAAIALRTAELADGYVRAQIVARFQGVGKAKDAAVGQTPTEYPLPSNGTLEKDIVNALQSGFHPLR